MNSNDSIVGIRVSTQLPLDVKTHKASQAVLADLGENNNLAYTYYKGMLAYCVAERTEWEWREPLTPTEIGLLPSNFTYPSGLIVAGIDYSDAEYNFFPKFVLSPTELQRTIDTLDINIGWKKGRQEETKVLSSLPKLVTNTIPENVIYRRNGFIAFTNPRVVAGLIEYPNHLEGTVDELPVQIHEVEDIHNLIVDIKDFDLIRNYTPKLVISRYHPGRIKHTFNPKEKPNGDLFPETTIKKAKYRVNVENPAYRPSEIALSQGCSVIDFGQEHYFASSFSNLRFPLVHGPRPYAKGIGKKSQSGTQVVLGTSEIDFQRFAMVYLELHIKITVDEVDYLSVPLSRFKMQLSCKESAGTMKDSFIRFRHV